MEASARRSSKLLPLFTFFRLSFVVLLFLSLTGTCSVATSVTQRSPSSDRLFARQESNSSASLPVDLPASPTDFPIAPSSSDVVSSSSDVIPSSSPIIPTASSPSQPSPSPPPPTSISTSLSESTTFTSSTSASSQSETFSESPSIFETPIASSAVITPVASETSESASASILLTQPATTLFIDDTLPPPPTTATEPSVQTIPIAPSETSDPAPVGAASAGFWGNKAAVAATFTVVSLISAGLLVVAIITFLRRRSRAKQRKMEEDLYRDPSFIDDNGDRFSSPGASIRQKPLDPFTSNDVVYTGYGFQDPSAPVAYPATDGNNVSTRQLYDATVRPYQEQAGYVPATVPQLSDTSHTSGHSAYWTPNASQAAVNATPMQYMLPSQSQAQAAATYYTTSNNHSSIVPAPSNEAPVRASVDSFYGYRGNQQTRP